MKWFKHFTDAHDNLKFEDFLDTWKMMGYGVWWVCCELVASEVNPKKPRFSITKKKNWKKKLRKFSGISETTLDKILADLAENNLISKKALNLGSLSIPKMKEKCDEYTDRIGIQSRETPDKVSTKRREEKRIEEEESNSSFKKQKRYFKGEEMRFSKNKWWVIPKEGGEWRMFAGDLKDTELI